jgi:hypothetical protein
MAFRFGVMGFGFWLADWVWSACAPYDFRKMADPLLFFFIFFGWRWPRPRFLWLYGMGIGWLRDLSLGGLFGGWACSFGLAGWFSTFLRLRMELADPLAIGLYSAGLTLVAHGWYAWLVRWIGDAQGTASLLSWMATVMNPLLHGGLAVWAFPRLERVLKMASHPHPSSFSRKD